MRPLFPKSFKIPRVSPLLDSAEAAAVLNVRMQQVQRWAQSGRLESFKAGRRYRFSEQQLGRFLGIAENTSFDAELAPAGTVSKSSERLQAALKTFLDDLEERLANDLERDLEQRGLRRWGP